MRAASSVRRCWNRVTARAALESLGPAPGAPLAPGMRKSTPAGRKATPPVGPGRKTPGTPPRPSQAEPVAVTGGADFVNLGDWLRDDEGPKDTRMVVEEKDPTGDEN